MPLIMLGLFLLAFFTRQHVLNEQYRIYGPEIPFTLESALYYDRVAEILEHGSLPEHNHLVEYPDGIKTFEVYSAGSEYVYAWMSRILPSKWSLEHKLRFIERFVFCLGVPFMFLWIYWWTGTKWPGLLAGVLYSVSVSSVIRSTGQELSRENSGLPFLLAHAAFAALAVVVQDRRRLRLFWKSISAGCLAVSLCAWDMIQFYVLCWMLWQAFELIRKRGGFDFESVLLTGAALLAVAVFNPYQRAHGLLVSPVLLIWVGMLLWRFTMGIIPDAGTASAAWRIPVGILVTAGPLVLNALIGTYAASYGHFAELLWAKIRFCNVKPGDPGLLTFSQRIMWVPALHSSNWSLTIQHFPGNFLAIFASVSVLLIRPGALKSPRLNHLVFLSIISAAAYFLFVRFQVFLVLFGSAATGLAAWRCWNSRNLIKGVMAVVLVSAMMAEGAQVWRHPEKWGRKNTYFEELKELTSWLKHEGEAGPVLGNFGVSASIKAYAGKPIILHPKFETDRIRNDVKTYGETLFTKDEEAFRDWADGRGAMYYVHSRGELYPAGIEYQMRYFVDAVNPPKDAAVWLFESSTPESGTYFHYVWGNRKYRVYRILGKRDEAWARAHAAEAAEAFRSRDYERAERQAKAALERNPGQETAAAVLKRVKLVEH